jgi:hypothetical protein
LPLSTVDNYILSAHTSNNPDGSIRHYHANLSAPPEVALKGYGNASDVDVSANFQAFN